MISFFLAELVKNRAMMPIYQAADNAAYQTFDTHYQGNGVGAILSMDEISPSQSGRFGSDASVEEILHMINGVGHVKIYPAAFGITPNSSLLTAAMDVARGGQFTTLPATYPASAWYSYDDATCEYDCMSLEYLYWSIVSKMNILNDTESCDGIANEWKLCSPALFTSTDTLMNKLISDPQYKLPTIAPDGNYCPAATSVGQGQRVNAHAVFPNPANDMLYISGVEANDLVSITDLGGRVLTTVKYATSGIDISSLSAGHYIIKVSNTSLKLVVQ